MRDTIGRRTALIALIAAASATDAATDRAAADSVSDFYAGKQMKFILRSDPGGGFDLYSRLIATHIVRHIPGHPTIVAINMPGAGGIRAAGYVGEVAPRDGTVLTMIGQALPMDQALHFTPSLKVDLRTFGWVGNVNVSNLLTYTWHTSPTKTMEDARTRDTTLGGTGAGSATSWLPLFYNNVLGTKFKVVNGYQGGTAVKLAMERGEVEGYAANPRSALISASPELMRDKLISILVQIGVRKEKDLPDVPLLTDLARTPEDRAALDFICKAFAVGRPIGTTPGVPPERLAALRKAFDETLMDPDFIADAKRQNAEIGPMDGVTLQKLIDDVIATPQDIKGRVKAVMPERL